MRTLKLFIHTDKGIVEYSMNPNGTLVWSNVGNYQIYTVSVCEDSY